MDRRCVLKLAGMALIGAAGLPLPSAATNKDHNAMSFSPKDIANLADAYTADSSPKMGASIELHPQDGCAA
jgi:hypothetical protein